MLAACRPFGEDGSSLVPAPAPAPAPASAELREPPTLWSKHARFPFGNISGFYGAMSIAVDRHDDIILAGKLWTESDLGGGILRPKGDADVVVMKLGADGRHLWTRQFGDVNASAGADAVVVGDDGTIYVSGAVHGQYDGGPVTITFPDGPRTTSSGQTDALVLSLSSDGDFRWAKLFSGERRDSVTVARVEGASLFLLGETHSRDFQLDGAPIGSGVSGYVTARLDTSTGAYVASAQLPYASLVETVSRVVLADGSLLVIGSHSYPFPLGDEAAARGPFVARVDVDGTYLGGGRLVDVSSAVTAGTVGGDGSVYVAADDDVEIGPPARYRATISRLDRGALAPSWSRTFVGTQLFEIHRVTPTPNGVVVAGAFDHRLEIEERELAADLWNERKGFFLARYANGVLEWSKALERKGGYWGGIIDAVVDASGNTVVLADDGNTLMLAKIGR